MERQKTILKTLDKMNYEEKIEQIRKIVTPVETAVAVVFHRIDLCYFIEIYVPLKLYTTGTMENDEYWHGKLVAEVTTQRQIKDIALDLKNLGFVEIERPKKERKK